MEQLKVRTIDLEVLAEIRKEFDSYTCKETLEGIKEQKLKLTFSVKKFEDIILLEGNISGFLTIECCRCLESFNYPVNLKFSADYPSSTEEIDVEEEVRQALILNIPDKPLCKNDCAGLCSACGKNKNIDNCECKSELPDTNDTRWNKLKDILK